MNGAPSDYRDMLTRPCWYCRYWGGVYSGSAAVCARDGGHLRAMPEQGCAFYERLPGVDDDGWRPMLVDARSESRLTNR
jgi:hypothetical protein